MSQNFGFHGRVLRVDLTHQTVESLAVDASVYRHYLGGYGLGAWLMWKYFPAQAPAIAPDACFAICAGLFTGAKTPFSGRIQIVGKSPLTGTWADSNSGGSVASHLRRAGYDALLVQGRASQPTILVIQDREVRFESAGNLWGQEIPPVFDALKQRYGGKRDVGVSAIGPAGEKGSRIASVMNDRYHAFGRQGFGALYGSKNLKAIVVGGSGTLPIADRKTFRALCSRVNEQYKRDIGPFSRFMVYMAKPRWWLAWAYRTAGSASWNETFASAFPLPGAVPKSEQNVSWKGQVGKGITQAHYSNSHQVMNGLGLCMFTLITGNLPWLELLNALTGWGMDEQELLMTGERIQNLRNAFNRREGILPDDFVPHPRMLGQGDGLLPKGPLKGITVPLLSLRRDYFAAMDWDINTGLLSRERAQRLEMDTLLGDYVAP